MKSQHPLNLHLQNPTQSHNLSVLAAPAPLPSVTIKREEEIFLPKRGHSLIWMSSAFPLAAGCVQGLHHLHADLKHWLVSTGIKADWWCNN
jgi:hypothetical protein